ncbi:MAG: primosomal protein N' [Pseudomonadota bacterium]
MSTKTVKIAVKTPLYRLFDYLPPESQTVPLVTGARVRVPFGRRRVVGLVWETDATAAIEASRLRRIERVLDTEPVVPDGLFALLKFASSYYQHAPGEVVAAALPRALRDGEALWPEASEWQPEPALDAEMLQQLLQRAPQQFEVAQQLINADVLAHETLSEAQRRALKALADKQLVRRVNVQLAPPAAPAITLGESPPLNDEQATALAMIPSDFAVTLLDGVTGSGKTEVYLRAIARVLEQQREVLVLVPEIGLTPQLLARFEARFGFRPIALHSGLTDAERLANYRQAAGGAARIVVGTRSAVFCPLPQLGLIVVDEEHDTSLKQQEGFRYSARDLAIVRGQLEDVPVVLGSATPALESLHNVAAKRYRGARLTRRAGHAVPPTVGLIDTAVHGTTDGLAGPMRDAIDRHLGDGGQVLLHINRRGFAPTVICSDCGHILECHRCDARFTLHAAQQRLWCHHCDADAALPERCPACGSGSLRALGAGSERIEQALERFYPGETIVRIDSDSTRRRGALEAALAKATSGAARLLVGTQMLAKGHHFPGLTLVGVLNADQGLFGSEFRTAERLSQSLVQVAGRAGREDRRGEVLIQTDFPTHPLLATLLESGYAGFAKLALDERHAAGWPPFAHLALLRAQAKERATVWSFLDAVKAAFDVPGGVSLYGPVKALMERRAGRFRAQLLLHASERGALLPALRTLRPMLDDLVQRHRVRWSLDVDPVDLA